MSPPAGKGVGFKVPVEGLGAGKPARTEEMARKHEPTSQLSAMQISQIFDGRRAE
jgi:hypothetical protein